jgi:hypothetical protein
MMNKREFKRLLFTVPQPSTTVSPPSLKTRDVGDTSPPCCFLSLKRRGGVDTPSYSFTLPNREESNPSPLIPRLPFQMVDPSSPLTSHSPYRQVIIRLLQWRGTNKSINPHEAAVAYAVAQQTQGGVQSLLVCCFLVSHSKRNHSSTSSATTKHINVILLPYCQQESQ